MSALFSRRQEASSGHEARAHWDDKRAALVHAAPLSPAGPLLGWFTAWGAAILAAACLRGAGMDLGLGLGIADGVGGGDGFEAGLWLAVIQAGAFLAGGYGAARIARRNGTRHALLAWLVAMIATGADAIVSVVRDRPQVIADLGLPYWNGTGLGAGSGTVVALGVFATASLAGALAGGLLGQSANLAARKRAEHDLRPVVETAVAAADDPPGDRMAEDGRNESHRQDEAARRMPVAAHPASSDEVSQSGLRDDVLPARTEAEYLDVDHHEAPEEIGRRPGTGRDHGSTPPETSGLAVDAKAEFGAASPNRGSRVIRCDS